MTSLPLDLESQNQINVLNIIENAIYYGVDLSTEPHLAWIGILPETLELPPDWIKQVDPLRNDIKYLNTKTGIEIIHHPADLYLEALVT